MKNCIIDYNKLDKHFTAPKILSTIYDPNIKIPRKLKKKVKNFMTLRTFRSLKKHTSSIFNRLNNGERLWFYLENVNPNYKRFLIKKVVHAHKKN